MNLRFHLLLSLLALCLIGPLSAETPRTPAQKQVQEVYQASLKADGLLAQGKYSEAAAIVGPLQQRLAELLDSDEDAGEFLISVRPKELSTIRLLDLDYRELEGTAATEIRADRYVDVLEEVARMTSRVTRTDEFTTDSQIAAEAIAVVREAKKSPKDAALTSLAVRLRLAVAQLQGVLTRNPGLAGKTINEATPATALQEGKAALGSLEKRAATAQSASGSAMPQGARFVLDTRLELLAGIQKALDADGFVADADFDRWIVDPRAALTELRAVLKKHYDDQGQAMPPNAAQPVEDQAANLKALAARKAPTLSFPTGLVSDPAIASAVTSQLTKNLKGVKVLQVAMKGSEWGINKNDLGLIESRYRYGYALYQLPGEPWARCSAFSYREPYDGKGYQKASGASAYSATRWQQPR